MSDHGDDPIERAEAARAEAARRAAELQEEEEKRRSAGHGADDTVNPAHADLGANIRPDVVEAPGGLVTVTTQKSATYYPERDDEPDPAANRWGMDPPPEPGPDPIQPGPFPQGPEGSDKAADDPAALYVRELREHINAEPAQQQGAERSTDTDIALTPEAEYIAILRAEIKPAEQDAPALSLGHDQHFRDDMQRGEWFLDRLQERIESAPGYSPTQEPTPLYDLQTDIINAHDNIPHEEGEQYYAAIGADIREGTGFAAQPETQELVGDLLLSARAHQPTRGDDHETEADPAALDARELLERINNESTQRQNAERAAERGETVSDGARSPEAEYIALLRAEIKAAEHDAGEAHQPQDLTHARAPMGHGPGIF